MTHIAAASRGFCRITARLLLPAKNDFQRGLVWFGFFFGFFFASYRHPPRGLSRFGAHARARAAHASTGNRFVTRLYKNYPHAIGQLQFVGSFRADNTATLHHRAISRPVQSFIYTYVHRGHYRRLSRAFRPPAISCRRRTRVAGENAA